MTKEKLEQYRGKLAELEAVEQELAEHKIKDAVQTAANHPYSIHTLTISGLPPDDEVSELLNRKAILNAEIKEIRDFVNAIEDYITRKIFIYRYLNGYSWTKTAHKVGNNTSDSCRMKAKRFLRNS